MEETYLENHYIQQYFSDVVSMIAERRPDQPLRFMKEYFESIKSGEIVLRRDYDYIRATPANRLAFVSKYGEALNEIAEESLSVKDLHCVVELLCFDFPLSTVLHCGQLAAYISWKASSHSKSMDPPPRDPEDLFVPVSTFVRTLRFYLVFEEFFQCSERAIKDAVAALRRSAKKDPKTPLSQLVLTDVHYKQVSASVKATVLASLSNSPGIAAPSLDIWVEASQRALLHPSVPFAQATVLFNQEYFHHIFESSEQQAEDQALGPLRIDSGAEL